MEIIWRACVLNAKNSLYIPLLYIYPGFKNRTKLVSPTGSTKNRALIRFGKNSQNWWKPVKNQIEPGIGGKNGFCPNSIFETMIFIKPLGSVMGLPPLAKKMKLH